MAFRNVWQTFGRYGRDIVTNSGVKIMSLSQIIDATDETVIRTLVQAVEDGWNAGDGDAFAAPFAQDADYIIVNGRHIQGRPIIAEGHRQLFEGIYKGSHNRSTVHNVRFLREDVAVVHVEWNLATPIKAEMAASQPNTRTSTAYCTMVMTKEDGRWHIVAFHNTPVQAQ
jgi:uncharacterized protein (TIGR02246 family)